MVHRSLLALALTWLAAASASANGSYTHTHISQLAHAALPPGELRSLLDDPVMRHAYEAGSLFPDSGYAVSDEYGELVHWEPFLEAYIDHLRRTYAGDFSSEEARRQIAFLLGIASHGMADQSYDTTLLARAFEVDGPEPAGRSVDQYADYFLVIDEEVVFTVEAWAPYTDLPPVIAEASSGHVVSESLLESAMGRMETLTRVQTDPLVAGTSYWMAWESFPFLGTHIYNAAAVGSLPWLGGLVAEYWQVLWKRLHATDDPSEDLVLRTVPEDGAVNWPVDPSSAWSRVGIFFGYGVDRDVVTPSITLSDEGGAGIDVNFATAYGGRDRNLVFVVPRATLDYDATYTVEIAAGLATLNGTISTEPVLFSFRTRCAEDRLSDCPPLDPPLVTGPLPVRPPREGRDGGPRLDAGTDAGALPGGGGGCSAAGSSRGGGALLLGALLVMLARRRR